MHKYDGLVIYQHHDDEGVIEVVEQKGIRSMHFGSSSRQSSIAVNDPESLQLPYTRAMTSWLLFKDAVDDVLMVGLGGGSLARHLLYYFPHCRLRAIEYRASVAKVARSHFGLPLDSRLKVIIEDGAHYVRQQSQTPEKQYSLIMVDAFDVDGLAPAIATLAFFDACKNLLKPDGLLVVNLWATDAAIFSACVQWLNQVFDHKLLLLPVRNRGNIVAVAFNKANSAYNLKELKGRAVGLEQHYQIEFPKLLKDFIKHNPYTLQTVISK